MDDGSRVYQRDKLYEEVWAEPIQTVARRYGVSDVALAKNCRKLGVPLPKRGHWAKVRAGQSSRRPKLPKLRQGQSDRIVTRERAKRPAVAVPAGLEEAVPSHDMPEISVPEELREPHALVKMSLKSLERAMPMKGVLRRPRVRCLDVHVSRGSLDRAMRIMDALIKALENEGMVARIQPMSTKYEPIPGVPKHYERLSVPKSSVTEAVCDDEHITLVLRETVRRIRGPKPKKERRWLYTEECFYQPPRECTYEPSGNLRLTLANAKNLGIQTAWTDAKNHRLEACLPAIVAQVRVAAVAMRHRREELEKQRIRREEEAERMRQAKLVEQEKARQRELQQLREGQRERELLAVVARWRLAKDIREYVSEIEHSLWRGDFNKDEREEVGEELKWAKAFAARTDPVRCFERTRILGIEQAERRPASSQ